MSRARDLADGTFSGTVTADDILLSDADTPTLTLTDTTNTLSTFVQSGNSTAVIGTSTNHDLRFFTNNSEKARILSGGGITFNGDTAAANALDDYEEGTWTPTYDSTSTDPVVTYGVQVGTYTKVGNMVTVWFRIRTSSITSQGTGTLRVSNLPFTNSNTTNLYGGFTLDYTNDWNSGNSPGGGYGATNQNRIYLIKRASSDARSDLDTGVLASNLYTGGSANDVIGCGIYMVD